MKATFKNIVITAVITPVDAHNGEASLEMSTSVSVNGKQFENVQVGLVLAGDVQLGITSGAREPRSMRALASGAVALVEALREQALDTLEQSIVQVAKAQEASPEQPEVLAPAE